MSDGQARLHDVGGSLCQVGQDHHDRGDDSDHDHGQDHHDRGDDSDDEDAFDDVGVGDDNEVGIMLYCGKVMSKSC